MTRKTGIPAPVGVQDPAVARILWALREHAENQQPAPAARTTRRAGGGSTGGGSDDTNPIRPLAPEGFNATGIFGAVILELSRMPPGAAYVEWLAATENDIGTAVVVGTSVVPLWRHYVGTNVGRYYWARGVGQGAAALRGPISDMVYAESAKDPEFLKSQLDQQLEKSQLAQALAEEINLITAPATTAGSVAWRAAQLRREYAPGLQSLELGFDNHPPGDKALPVGWRGGNEYTGYVEPIGIGDAAYGCLDVETEWSLRKCWRLLDAIDMITGSTATQVESGLAFVIARFYRPDAFYLGEARSDVLTETGDIPHAFPVIPGTGYVELVLIVADSEQYAETVPLWFDNYDDRVRIRGFRAGDRANTRVTEYS